MSRGSTGLAVHQVVGFVPTGWMYEMKRSDFPVRKKGSCKVRVCTLSSVHLCCRLKATGSP
jgi:hypothetical protein